MDVVLPPDLEGRIAEEARAKRLAALDADIRRGLNQPDLRDAIPGASVLAAVDTMLDARPSPLTRG
jgi:hypothetical protein